MKVHQSSLNLLVIDALSNDAIACLQPLGNVIYLPSRPDREVVEHLPSCDVLVLRSGHRLTPGWLARAIRLKAVVRAGVGMDNIPVQHLRERGILLANVPTASTVSVAEYAIGAIIALARNMFPGHRDLMDGQWNKDNLIGHELAHKTVGLVGFGNIGKAIARRLQGFDVRLLAGRSTDSWSEADGVPIVPLRALANEAELISVQVPLTALTHHLIDARLISEMRRSPFLVNVSRYDVIDMAALRDGLRAGKLQGALIDPIEPDRFDPAEYEGLPVYPLPHLGGSTFEAQARIGRLIADQLIEWGLCDGPREEPCFRGVGA